MMHGNSNIDYARCIVYLVPRISFPSEFSSCSLSHNNPHVCGTRTFIVTFTEAVIWEALTVTFCNIIIDHCEEILAVIIWKFVFCVIQASAAV